jgi:RHS repeat-associated protein
MTRPNSVTTNYAYDNLSRLTSVLHQLSGSTIDGATYTVDNAGNRTAKTDKQTNVTSNYTYDSIYQLLTAAQGGSTTESYSYDPVGNRTASLGVSSYTTNSSNELTAMTGASFTYDYNGNTTSKTASGNTTNYSWDYENHLTSVTLPGTGGTVSFVYDPFGRRIKKVSSAGTSIFAYDGDNLIEETNSSGTVVARYSQGLNIDEPLAMLRSSATTYYNADGLGSITSLANTSGTLTQTYTFDSFGKQTASSGSLVNSFQYTARESDAETGLYYYRARYYDAVAGRFISADPLRLTGDVNLFAYVDQNPINAFDPLGLCKIIVKFNKVIKGLPGYHAYIVTIDPSGAMMGFRGGPGQNGNIDTLSRDYSPKSKNDPYGFPDYNPKSTPCITVLDNDKPCREYNYKLMSALADIANTNTPYPWYPFLPGSRNSNSVASDALSVSGLPVPAPPVWAPGWGNPILPFGNGGVTSGPSGPVGGGRGGPF